MRLRVGAHTDVGRQRSENQDYLLYRIATREPDAEGSQSLFVAADGVGGAVGGAVASKVAAETVEAHVPRQELPDPAATLVAAIHAANRAVIARADANAQLAGMGTTLVAAIVRAGQLWLANVGDSRAYLLRGGALRQLTDDHSVVAEAIRAGRLTTQQAAHHPYRHVITRSLGADDDLDVDTFGPMPLQPGDRLLLCTDGLTEPLELDAIARLVQSGPPPAAARALVDAANEAGGPDNVSVLVVEAVT